MRLALRILCVAGLIPLVAVGSSAFNYAQPGGRMVTVDVVGDAAAYLAVATNADSPHDCFALEQSAPGSENGKIQIGFGDIGAACAGDGGGTGVNEGDGGTGKYSRYAFHDLLKVTNKGTRSILLWVNATTSATSSGQEISVAKEGSSGQMTDADYATSSATGLTLTVGSTGYVGVRVKSGTLSSGNAVSGTVEVVARGI